MGVGRSHLNRVAVASEAVSRHHAALFIADGRAWVQDLGSTNGTRLNGQPVDTTAPLVPGDELDLAGEVVLRVAEAPVEPTHRDYVLEDLDHGTYVPLDVGENHVDGLSVELSAQGRAVITTAEESWAVVAGQPVEVEGRMICVTDVRRCLEETAPLLPGWRPYRVVARRDGATGVEAVVHHARNKASVRFAGNKAVVVYLLARQLLLDRKLGLSKDDEGWVHDDDLALGIWGRGGPRMDANGLHVLVYRLRRDLDRAGLDGAVLEKRRKALRLRVVGASITGETERV